MQESSSSSSKPWGSTPQQERRGKKAKASFKRYAQQPRKVEQQFGNPAGVYIKKDIEDEYYTGVPRHPSPKPSVDPSSKSTPPSIAPQPQQQNPSGDGGGGKRASDLTNVRSKTKLPQQTAVGSADTPIVSLDTGPGISTDPPLNFISPSITPQLRQQKPSNSGSGVGGKLTSDLINVKTKIKKAPQKVHVTGGTAMRGASAELTDLESALRALEVSTDPTANQVSSRCDCAGTRHEVLAVAPNCLSCGKIICIMEGLAPCSFCGSRLIPADELQSMVRELREERGREKMAADRLLHKRPEVARAPRPFTSSNTSTPGTSDDEGLKKATEHRDRLLGFQATSAQRTKIIDQAADFETPMSAAGANIWATPQERALQLKKQQKAMRQMEWDAKQAYEKRRIVVAIDLKGRKVVKEMRDIELPQEPDSTDEEEAEEYGGSLERGGSAVRGGAGGTPEGSGTFSRNPLLKGMIKPVYTSKKGKEKEAGSSDVEGRAGGFGTGWRRVQDDFADNEGLILDGGAHGQIDRVTEGDEPACG